jgi:Ca-activated chloride channel family protein
LQTRSVNALAHRKRKWGRLVRRWLTVCAFVLAVASAHGQALVHRDLGALQPSAPVSPDVRPSSSVFRSGIDVVALNVVVTDAQQKFVNGLTAHDFAVFEDGVAQDLSFFSATHVPLDLAILLDTSASMGDKMKSVQEAAVGFASSVREGDRVMIVDIKDSTRILQPLTEDVKVATAAIDSTTAKGGTGLYNGLYLTLKELANERRTSTDMRRQAIAVLSDGDDTTSLVSFDDVMDAAKRSGIAVYTITLRSQWALQQAMQSGHRYFSQSEYAMKALAIETGGRSFFPMAISELNGVYGSIADELANEYALGYTPKNLKEDGKYRRVLVQVMDHPGVRTRTRAGYMAPRVQ